MTTDDTTSELRQQLAAILIKWDMPTRQAERQRIADSLPENFPEIGVTQNQIDWARGFNEAIEAVRAVLEGKNG